MGLKISVSRKRVMHWVEENSEYFGKNVKAALMTVQTSLMGLISIFTARVFIPFVTRPINLCHITGPTAYSRLTLSFLRKLVPWSTCARRHKVGTLSPKHRHTLSHWSLFSILQWRRCHPIAQLRNWAQWDEVTCPSHTMSEQESRDSFQ